MILYKPSSLIGLEMSAVAGSRFDSSVATGLRTVREQIPDDIVGVARPAHDRIDPARTSADINTDTFRPWSRARVAEGGV